MTTDAKEVIVKCNDSLILSLYLHCHYDINWQVFLYVYRTLDLIFYTRLYSGMSCSVIN